MIAPLPTNEAERLTALREHRLLDTPPEREFDDLVHLAAHICGVPVAAISFIDAHRQWFKSILGVGISEVPRDAALCAHTILQSDLLVVSDTRTDPRFQDNPQVTGDPGVRFYAGASLITEDGYAIGTLCVADTVPRQLMPDQEEGLRLLAHLAAGQLKSAYRITERECLVAEKESLVAEKESLLAQRARTEADLAQTYAALTESEERLRRLTDAAFEGISVSQDGVLVDASPAFAALFGYDSAAQVLGLITKELAAPESRALVARKIDGGDEQPYEAEMKRRDGTTFQAELRGRMIQLHGRPARVTAVRDISDRKQAEERFRVLFEHSSDAHLLFGEDGIIDCNDATISLLRCTDKTQVLSLHPAVLSPEFQPDGRRSLEKCVEMDALAHEKGFHRFEWMHCRVDGEELPIEVTLTPVTLAERPVLLVVWHDLTAHKQAEAALRASHERLSESETRLRLALESGGLGSYDLDQATIQFLEISDTYKAQFGLPPDAPLSPDTVFAMFHPDDQAHMHEAVRRANAEGSIWQEEHRVIWDDGSVHWFRAHGLPIYDQTGQPARMIGVTQDITDRKELEAERERLAERERNIAFQLQAALQPPLPASVPHLAVAAYTCPALDEAEVGGDFYDCFALDEELYALVIGDVSGKGLAAAQQLALIRNSLRMALYLCRRPAEVAARLNAIVTSHGLLVGFATAFVGVYNTAKGELTYTSCAHEPGLVRRAGGAVEEMETTGPPLGMDEDSVYDERRVTLSTGDSLLLYTDGLSESGPSRRELLGTEGMMRLFGESPKEGTLQAQAESLMVKVKSLAGGTFRDDVTVLLAHCR